MKKRTKRIFISIILILSIPVLCIGGYIGYMSIQYYRIDDNVTLETTHNPTLAATTNNTFTIATYNIGFGAYDHDFSFFMDSGEMKDGTAVQGKHARAQSKKIVNTNTIGAIHELQKLNADFYLAIGHPHYRLPGDL